MFFSRKKSADKEKGRVLIIEDEADILEVLKLMLEDAGHEVRTAATGTAGLAEARKKPFDIVVMDVSMPGMSGIDVARELRADAKTEAARIVFHTGLDERWVRERFTDYDLFATKAKDVEQLVAGIARLIAEPKRDAVAAPAAVFSTDDLLRARQALRGAMGLGAVPLDAASFVGQLADEIDQLRKLGKNDVSIADMIGSAIGRPLAPSLVTTNAAAPAARSGKRG